MRIHPLELSFLMLLYILYDAARYVMFLEIFTFVWSLLLGSNKVLVMFITYFQSIRDRHRVLWNMFCPKYHSLRRNTKQHRIIKWSPPTNVTDAPGTRGEEPRNLLVSNIRRRTSLNDSLSGSTWCPGRALQLASIFFRGDACWTGDSFWLTLGYTFNNISMSDTCPREWEMKHTSSTRTPSSSSHISI